MAAYRLDRLAISEMMSAILNMKRLQDDMFSNPQIKQPFGSLCGDWRIVCYCFYF
ncbi:hypothetical protein Hanom_Chr00s000001g01598421 [Helianthus anomalus]